LSYYKDTYAKSGHPDIISTRSNLAQLYYIQGDRKESKSELATTTQAYLEYIDKYFNYLTEREKQEFWKKIKPDFEFYKTIAFEKNSKKDVQTVYNNTLNTKEVYSQSLFLCLILN